MKMSKYCKSLVFITIISLSFCLSVQNVHATDEDANRANECGGALTGVPSVLKPVGVSNNTEIKETSAIDIPGVKKGVFSFLVKHFFTNI